MRTYLNYFRTTHANWKFDSLPSINLFLYYRNPSQGSSDTGFFGSMEKEKRRREALGEGRVDAETVITELLESVDLDKVVQEADDAESEYSTFWGDFWISTLYYKMK